jgi:hypothetical protein
MISIAKQNKVQEVAKNRYGLNVRFVGSKIIDVTIGNMSRLDASGQNLSFIIPHLEAILEG